MDVWVKLFLARSGFSIISDSLLIVYTRNFVFTYFAGENMDVIFAC